MSHYITTYKNIRFTPLAPRGEDIFIEDIAHALSLTCRAGGHLRQFFSVAQHCLNCAAEARARGLPRRLELACLLHDAAECYLSDLIRPVKRTLPAYCAAEDALLGLIYERFGLGRLTGEEQRAVEEIDDACLYCEFLALKGEVIEGIPRPDMASRPDFSLRPFEEVEREYLALFRALGG